MLRPLSLVLVALACCCPLPCSAQDADNDGLPDAIEEVLGTDPGLPEALQVVIEDGPESEERRLAAGYDPGKDILTVEFGHVAEDRYLWRVTFAGPPTPEDTVLHLYVDADADATTGREGPAAAGSSGTEYMLSVVGGSGTSGRYAKDGTREAGPPVSFAVAGNSLLISADVELARDERGASLALFVLCHTVTQAGARPAMEDSTRKTAVDGIALNDRKKTMRPMDFTESAGVTQTFGLDVLRPFLVAPTTLEVPYDRLQCDGFAVDIETQRRFGHVSALRAGGRVWTQVPRAGRLHVGFMMYDDYTAERVAIRINDELAGVVVADRDNNRTWLSYLSEPRDLTVDDRVSLEAAGANGKHGICDILFFTEPPETRSIEYEVTNTRWTVPAATSGRVSLSWTTSWPSTTRFEYGPTTDYGQVATEDCFRMVHKVRLEGLDPEATYHGRGVGVRPDGESYYGPDITFTAAGLRPPPTQESSATVALTVGNPHDFPITGWPVTQGVPFPQGVLGSADDLRLTLGGAEVLAQVSPTGMWPDGSVKWVLISLLADVPAGGVTEYALEYGRGVSRKLTAAPMAAQSQEGVTVDTGGMTFSVDRHGQIVDAASGAAGTTPGRPIVTTLTDSGGHRYSSALADAETTLEENGPVRTVIRTVGSLTAEDGTTCFRVEQRVEAFRGRPYLRIRHTFTNDRPEEFTEVESLSVEVPLASAEGWTVPLARGEALSLQADGPGVHQRFDGEFARGEQATEGRVLGAALSAAPDSGAVAIRDFWQQYPKALIASADSIRLELCPDFEPGLYDAFPFEKEGHQLYYYLLGGHYRIKTGMAKTHELFLCLAPPEQRENLARLFQQPLLLVAPPDWYCDSKAFYSVAPRDEVKFKAYEAAIDRNLAAYEATRERQHDFGMMNYGDWYGERGANWGNIEYDTQHAFFLEFIRSGNPAAFFLGDATELHNRDVDTVQWAANPANVGLVYVHQMGHLGGYYTESVPGTLGIPRAGGSVSHAWTEGHFDHYFLTGDRRSLQTGMAVADYFTDKAFSRPYDFVSCRDPGWHLILNAAALAATGDPYYLNASRLIVDRVLETQDVEPRELPEYQKELGRTHQVGGWTRMMLPGHCLCEPRHRGNAGFMVAVLLSGLTYFHDVTQDPAVKECIIRGARYLVEDTYSEEVHGFRYTSCPNMRYTAGASPLMVEGIARAYRWTRDPLFEDVLTNALSYGAGGSPYGKGFSMYYRCAPRVLADLDACGLSLEERAVPAAVPFRAPEWMAQLAEDQRIIVQAEDFAAQGEGEVEIVGDRQATMGKMITKWHQDEGHWLQWDFEVPRAAPYKLIFRYATAGESTRRRVEIDGAVPHAAAEAVAFRRTGGYGHSPADWQFRTLADEAGQDVVLRLAQGKHTLRMTNLGDGLALDFAILVKAD